MRPDQQVPVIAIDGPSASGKSSTAAAVAQAMGWVHLDSGALYRGLTLVANDLVTAGQAEERAELPPEVVLAEAERRGLSIHLDFGAAAVWIDGTPAEDRIRTEAVTSGVSAVSAVGPLRDWVNHQLRSAARAAPGAVVDGRDIGTVVFPDAPLKIFLIATPRTRAARRLDQRGERYDEERLARETALLAARDDADSRRPVAPLRKADNALALDGTSLTFGQQVDWIVAKAKERGLTT